MRVGGNWNVVRNWACMINWALYGNMCLWRGWYIWVDQYWCTYFSISLSLFLVRNICIHECRLIKIGSLYNSIKGMVLLIKWYTVLYTLENVRAKCVMVITSHVNFECGGIHDDRVCLEDFKANAKIVLRLTWFMIISWELPESS